MHAGDAAGESERTLLGARTQHAAIQVYDAPDTIVGFLDAFNAMATGNSVQVVSSEWGLCEANLQGVSGFVGAVPSQHGILKQLAAQGVSILAASGDFGAYDCGNADLSVHLPAADPYVIAVGATNLTINTAIVVSSISGESAWSCVSAAAGCTDGGPKGLGTGGGLSTIFHTGDIYNDDLSWQVGPGVANSYSNGYPSWPSSAFLTRSPSQCTQRMTRSLSLRHSASIPPHIL